MPRELGLYISAAAEMDAECELVGQLLARIPRSVRWKIKRTPRSFEFGNPDLEQLRQSQFHLFLVGMDIQAPMGVEWEAAHREQLFTLAYRNIETLASPAAAAFVRESGLAWRPYKSSQEFIQMFERDLITRLIEGTPGYGLYLEDIEELAQRLRALEEPGKGAAEERRGAGRGGVILPSA